MDADPVEPLQFLESRPTFRFGTTGGEHGQAFPRIEPILPLRQLHLR